MSNTDEIVSFLYSSGENAALNALQTKHNVDKVPCYTSESLCVHTISVDKVDETSRASRARR